MRPELVTLFDAVRGIVLSIGGDGDGWIVAPNYVELATLFEIHEASNEGRRWFTERSDGDDAIVFSHHQEHVGFGRTRPPLDGFAEIVVELGDEARGLVRCRP